MSRPFVGIGVPLVVRFGPADVGRRVTLRRRLPDTTAGEPSLGDVVGLLQRWSGDSLTLRRRTGDVVHVPLGTVVAGRVVAPELSAADVSTRADDSWRAHEVEPLGQWRLRAHGGLTHRPNSALAVGDPGMSLPDTAEVVRRWYTTRDLPASVMTPVPSPVADAYRALGWGEQSRTLVMSAHLADVVEAAHDVDAAVAHLTEDLPADWSAVLARLRDPSIAPLYRELLTGTPASAFATVRGGDGAPLAVARGAISDGWVNLTNVEVIETARGRRLAVPVIDALARWSLERRATHAYLQMWPDNASALRLYERLGFTRHHEYAYFVAPST